MTYTAWTSGVKKFSYNDIYSEIMVRTYKATVFQKHIAEEQVDLKGTKLQQRWWTAAFAYIFGFTPNTKRNENKLEQSGVLMGLCKMLWIEQLYAWNVFHNVDIMNG